MRTIRKEHQMDMAKRSEALKPVYLRSSGSIALVLQNTTAGCPQFDWSAGP